MNQPTQTVLTQAKRRELLFEIATSTKFHPGSRMKAIELDAKLAGELHEKLDANWRRRAEEKPIQIHLPAAIAFSRAHRGPNGN